MQIVGEHATGQLLTLDTLTLRVSNRTDHALAPHFTVTLGPYMSTPWIVHRGPKNLEAHRTATYAIWAPNIGSMPAVATGFEVYVFTVAPQAISASALYQPVAEHTQITPEAVNHVILAKDRVTFAIRVLDRLNQPVQRAGIPVYLGQIVYAQEGLFPGETSINGRPEGQSPVAPQTDTNGVAHFTVRAIQVQPFEVFYQAWLQHSYSQESGNKSRVENPRPAAYATGARARCRSGRVVKVRLDKACIVPMYHVDHTGDEKTRAVVVQNVVRVVGEIGGDDAQPIHKADGAHQPPDRVARSMPHDNQPHD